MDRLFDRSIICTYPAWREAKERGSWFVLLIITMLFVVMMSTHGCAIEHNQYLRIAHEGQREANKYNGHTTPALPPLILQADERLETDREALLRGAFPGSYRIIRVPPQPYDACSIYGMDQSVWLSLTERDRQHQVFVNYWHGYQDRHLPVPRGTKPALPTDPNAPQQAEQPDVQRGMNWEDQYDYGGDGQNDGGGDGGFLP
jgi:hypothetical protein